jgi:uncharacterized iron-regulated membrane protein
MRFLFSIHRWTGIAVGLMAFTWFASGIVVHWYAFVDATEAQLLGGYSFPLDSKELRGVRLPAESAVGAPMRRSVLHRLERQLVWETETGRATATLTDARSGTRRAGVTLVEATAIAGRLVSRPATDAQASVITKPDAYYYEQSFRYEFSDQQSFPLPAYRVVFGGPNPIGVYVDPTTGRVAAVVGRRQRLTRLFGTLPHFLNPRFLRGHATLRWVILVVLLLGAFVSGVSGLVYGIWILWRQRRARAPDGPDRRRPLRRLIADWHNWIGAVLGALVVTWAVSGYLMLWYPEVTPSPNEIARLEGGIIRPSDYRLSPESALTVVSSAGRLPVVALQARRLLQRPVYDARHLNGRSTVVDGRTGVILSPLPDSIVRSIVRAYLGRDDIIRRISYLDHYDAYYYDLHGRLRPLPVYRIDLASGNRAPSPLYVDADRGELVGRVDGDYRTFRWYGSALHTMDFPVLFFHPTLWHVVLVGLALLGAILSGTGVWLGFTYLLRLSRSSTSPKKAAS